MTGRYILVADEDPKVMRSSAFDGRSAVELVYNMRRCDLVISNTKVDGMPGVELIRQLRRCWMGREMTRGSFPS